MSIEATRGGARRPLLLICTAGLCSLAAAQPLSPPIGPATPAAGAAAASSAMPGAGAANGSAAPSRPGPGMGVGPGFHDPRSAFKPLAEREGVVSWKLLSSVTAKLERNRIVPMFPPSVQALHGQTVKVQGFMMPLEAVGMQKHFLLSSVPTTCSFCIPAGPEGLVEVRMATPVRYTIDALTVQGRLQVLQNDRYGLFYRIEAAEPAPN